MATLSTLEKIKRIYTELVKRRARVRIVRPKEQHLDFRPIFIIGPPRSGTTLVRYIIDSHSRICCPPETNFIGILRQLVESPESSEGLESLGFSQDHVEQKIRELGIYFWGNYAHSQGKHRWADKSISHVDHLHFIERIYPEAQFIIIYRHGLDQAHSFTKGGKVLDSRLEPFVNPLIKDPRIAATQFWVSKVNQMQEFEQEYPDKTERIFYEDLCCNPENELIPIFKFLNEPWEPSVLEFYKFEHDKGPEHGRTAITRGFSVSKDNYLLWPEHILAETTQIAGPTLNRLGYSFPTV